MERFFFTSPGAGKVEKIANPPGCPRGGGDGNCKSGSMQYLELEHLLQCNTVILQNEMM